MPRADFYLLPAGSQPQRFACALSAKAMQEGHRIYIYTDDDHSINLLDDMLWIYQDISFVPHALFDDRQSAATEQAPEPVMIGCRDELPPGCDVLVNMSTSVPAVANRCARVVEIITGDEDSRARGRDRYRDYRDRDFEMHTHQIDRPPV